MHFKPSLPKKTLSFVCRSIVYGVPYCRPKVPQQPAGNLDCGWYTALFFQHVVRSVTTSTLSDVRNKFAYVFTSEMFSHSQIDTYRDHVQNTMVPMYVSFHMTTVVNLYFDFYHYLYPILFFVFGRLCKAYHAKMVQKVRVENILIAQHNAQPIKNITDDNKTNPNDSNDDDDNDDNEEDKTTIIAETAEED